MCFALSFAANPYAVAQEPIEPHGPPLPEKVTISHGVSFFGDLKYGPNFKHFEYADPNAPKGGSIVFGSEGTFNSLNPFILKGTSADGLTAIYDSLLIASADEPFSEYGLLAESVEIPADKSWIVFNLRPYAKWHDGTPITADDVVFSFNILKTKGHPFYRNYYRDVTKVEKLSKTRVKFIFSTGENRELPLVIGQLPILPKAYYKTHRFEDSTLIPPLGSGPYKVTKVNPGKSVTYERVKNYWAKDLPVNVGRNNFDKVVYTYYRDSAVAVEAFKAGEYDLRQENISKTWAMAYNIPAVKNGKIIKEEIDHDRPSGMQGFVFNTRRNKFKDRRVREAVNLAFDFDWENKHIFYGAYTRSESYFANSIYAAEGLPNKQELELLEPWRNEIPPEVFTTPFHTPRSDGSGYNRANLLKAKALLEEAGWVIKNHQRVNKETGEPLNIEFLISSPSFERVVAPLIRNLSRLGIQSTMRIIDDAQFQKRLEAFDFDVTVFVYSQTLSPGNEQIDYWHSSQVNVHGSQNMAGVSSPAVDNLVEHILHAQTEEDLIAATRALDRVLLYGYYVIPNWHIHTFRVIYWNKFSRPAILPRYALSLDTWWVKDMKPIANANQRTAKP